MAGDDDEGGEEPEYCSLSEGMVTPDSAMGFGGSSDAMMRAQVSEYVTVNPIYRYPEVQGKCTSSQSAVRMEPELAAPSPYKLDPEVGWKLIRLPRDTQGKMVVKNWNGDAF